MDSNLKRSIDLLEENDKHIRDSAFQVLSTLCDKVLGYPEEEKYRQVQLDDPAVVEQLLPASGAMECLFDIGFVEDGDRLSLPRDAPLANIRALQKYLLSKSVSTTTRKKKGFFTRIAQYYKGVKRYEDTALQKKARNVVPVVQLQVNAMNRMRELQREHKVNCQTHADKPVVQSPEEEITMKELFMLELLHWFKYDFFKWMDSPTCTNCSEKCSFVDVKSLHNPQYSRIEIYRCKNCSREEEFPRYTDPEPLLSLRHGRCGEWANVFTLLCRAFDYDARLVLDETDHVWTEIWCESTQRWIHVDPCENKMDYPLMYEKGWNKKLSYIIAFSKDEVQDVTWRYTRDYIGTMKRRQLCSEESLLALIIKLNTLSQAQENYSDARKQYVLKRRIKELASMLYIPNNHNPEDDKSYEGRSSGSYAWRLARGEVSQDPQKNFTWEISKHGFQFDLRYSIVKDVYKTIGQDDIILEEKSSWIEGVDFTEGGIFRKVEEDWKMVYLVRSPSSQTATVRWTFCVNNPDVHVQSFSLQTTTETFHNGEITWEVKGYFDKNEESCITLPIPNSADFNTDKLKGALKIQLTAKLSGGTGDVAWQHAQLFRQSLSNEQDQSMSVKISLDKRRQ